MRPFLLFVSGFLLGKFALLSFDAWKLYGDNRHGLLGWFIALIAFHLITVIYLIKTKKNG